MTSAQGTSRPAATGIVLALVSALSFGFVGVFASPLLAAGWSPGATALTRVGLAALVLAVPAAFALRGRWTALWRARWRILVYATVAIAGTQLAFYAAIDRIPVGTALLVQYLAPLLLILVVWARTRQRPARIVLAGSGLSLLGLALVIGPAGLSGGLDLVGLGFSALAMIGVAVYFVLSAVPDDGVPPVALAASGFAVSALVLSVAGVVGILPIAVALEPVTFAGAQVDWWMPLAALVLVSTALAYVCGITAAGRLGSRTASFFGLLEVVFATVSAWLLLGQSLQSVQILGSALVVLGVVVVKLERTAPVTLSTVPLPVITVPGSEEHAPAEPSTVTAPIDIMSLPTSFPTPVPAESLAEPTSVSMPVHAEDAATGEAPAAAELDEFPTDTRPLPVVAASGAAEVKAAEPERVPA